MKYALTYILLIFALNLSGQILGQAISGTTAFLEVNSTYSAVDYNILGTISGDPTIVIDQGYCPASNTVKSSVMKEINLKYPITLSAAGLPRSLGTISVLGTGIGGISVMRVTHKWIEIR